MNNKKNNFILLLPALTFTFNELIRTFIRPEYGKIKYGLLSEILGWLPNLLAGFGIFALGTALVIFIQMVQKKEFSSQLKWSMMAVVGVIALTGLITHEITQKGTGLYYDLQDIYATIAGVTMGIILYLAILFPAAGIDPKH